MEGTPELLAYPMPLTLNEKISFASLETQ